jgi:hypothetical protein
MSKENSTVLEIVRETLDDSIVELTFPYTTLKRLQEMDIKTIRDFRDYEFDKDEDEDILNTQRHFIAILWERDWYNEEQLNN